MEYEWKFQKPLQFASAASFWRALGLDLKQDFKPAKLAMRAHYFAVDPPGSGPSCRFRQENQQCFLTFKMRERQWQGAQGLTLTHEAEAQVPWSLTEARTILTAAGRLKNHVVRKILEQDPFLLEHWVHLETQTLVEQAACCFERQRVLLTLEACCLELAWDEGAFLKENGAEQAFSELEMEFKSGSLEAFEQVVQGLKERWVLMPGTESKLKRALAWRCLCD